MSEGEAESANYGSGGAIAGITAKAAGEIVGAFMGGAAIRGGEAGLFRGENGGDAKRLGLPCSSTREVVMLAKIFPDLA